MGIFGWNLPPGVSHRMIENAYGAEGPCEVCAKPIDNCICPECPVCAFQGDLKCYEVHGMVRNEEQIKSAALAKADDAVQVCIENMYGCELDIEENGETPERAKALADAKVKHAEAIVNLNELKPR